MNLKKRISSSINLTAAVLVTSFFIPIIPCKTLNYVPTKPLQWGLCSLNPDTYATNTAAQKFFGLTSSLTDAVTITIIATFIISFFVGKYIKFGKL